MNGLKEKLLPKEIDFICSINNWEWNEEIDREDLKAIKKLSIYYGYKISSFSVKEGKITKLDLMGNELTSLHGSISQLINLQELDLSNNELVSLPESINQLINLEKLDLSNNELVSLPGRIDSPP